MLEIKDTGEKAKDCSGRRERISDMARGFLYVYERIYKGETEMQTEFRKISVNGKRTSVADQKRVRKIISRQRTRNKRRNARCW